MKYSRNRLLFSGKFQGGLTLIEILVSLAISVLVIAGVLEVYTSSKQTYRVQEASSRLQENGRFAISFIARDLRMAGHVGCLSQLSDDNQRLSSSLNSQPLYDLHLPVAGYHYDGTGWQPLLDENQIIDPFGTGPANMAGLGTGNFPPMAPPVSGPHTTMDMLTIRTVERTRAKLNGNMGIPTDPIALDPDHGLQQGDVIVISDCAADELISTAVQIPNAVETNNDIQPCAGEACNNLAPGNALAGVATAYTTEAEIFRVVVKTYYIAENDEGQPSLFMLINNRPVTTAGANPNPQELIAGVENMRVVYGIDTNDDDTADRYLEAAGITNNIDDDATPDWEDVVSVRVSLLIESLDDNLTTEPTTYFYAGTPNFQSLDRRIHRAFSTTVGVRNRNP